MRHTLFLTSPKKEEEQIIENSLVPGLPEFDDVGDELEGVLGIEESDSFSESKDFCGQQNWDYTDWEGFGVFEEKDSDLKVVQMGLNIQESHCFGNMKRENCGFWDDYDKENKKVSLNLSLDYQQVLDAWSDRGSLFAHEHAQSTTNSGYMGEVPVMEQDRRRRSVLRYKEKRQNRLFPKRIRYQVRKLNADNRPRLKGRFVRRMPEKRPKG